MEGGFVFLAVMACFVLISATCIAVAGIIRAFRDDDFEIGCTRDNDCSYWEECIKGSCHLSCRNKKCPSNEHCVSYFHTSTCECLPGYVRGRNSMCRNNMIIPKGLKTLMDNVANKMKTSP